MKTWRLLAIATGLGLMVGETWRSWGAGRPWLFVVDDYLIGIPLVVSAWLVAKPTLARRCAFAAAYAAGAGMLYVSFFSKIVEPASVETGNWSLDVLTWLVGLAFFVCVAGTVAAIALPAEPVDSRGDPPR